MIDTNVPIIVDLDGTLVKEDTCLECFKQGLRKNPLFTILLGFYFLFNRSKVKELLSSKYEININALHYNRELIDWLKQKKGSGFKLYLITGSTYRFANLISAKLDLFEKVYASSININLIGSQKAKLIEDYFGKNIVLYAGNSNQDLYVWKIARYAIICTKNLKLSKKVALICDIIKEFRF